MKKKLTLTVGDVAVESLATEAPAETRGTVHGQSGWDVTKVCSSGIDRCTDNVADCGGHLVPLRL